MTKLKFRVWDISHKMFLPIEIYDIHTRTDFGSFGVIRKDWLDYKKGEYLYDNSQILELSPYLKDKNGLDVYEGDILQGNKKQLVVVFQNGCFQTEFGLLAYTCSTREVIGNIHQNPELL